MTASNVSPTTTSSRNWDVAAHASPLVIAVVTTVATGRPFGWIAFLLPLGPVLIALAAYASGRPAPRALRSLIGFHIAAGGLIGVAWIVMKSNDALPILQYIFPLALIAFMLGIVNLVLIIVTRILRAWRGQTFDYPWVINPVARLVGLPGLWDE